MFDEQGRSLNVHRSYNYPNSTVAYSEPPRHRRISYIRNPFDEQFTGGHE